MGLSNLKTVLGQREVEGGGGCQGSGITNPTPTRGHLLIQSKLFFFSFKLLLVFYFIFCFVLDQ